jgi:hypothetical protein
MKKVAKVFSAILSGLAAVSVASVADKIMNVDILSGRSVR